MAPLVMVTRRGMAEWGGVNWLCLYGRVGHRLVSADRACFTRDYLHVAVDP